jgi:crotonobetainyl-CoA:carnitine CoA-transferase CaiB-like acyl-CoA transferase
MVCVSRPPLAGLRVVDFGLLLPGPFATRLLSDLGAEVIKVEPPHGDPGIVLLPGLQPFLERGKRSLRIDLKASGGSELALDLIASADVVLENFRPGVADRLGIGFARAAARRPGLVYCSISGYGQTGPDRDVPAHDVNAQAAGGAFAGALAVAAPITTPYLPFGDLAASLFAALTIAALAGGRECSSPAVHVDVSMQEAVAYMGVSRWGRYMAEGAQPQASDLVAYSPGAGVFRTADGGQIALAAIEDDFWSALCVTLGRADLTAPPYDTWAARMERRAELHAELAAAVAEIPRTILLTRLRAAAVPASPVRTVEEVWQDAHLRARGAIHGGPGDARVDYPARIGDERSYAADRLPRRGDERFVLDQLGISAEREQSLRATGALPAPS